VKFRLKDSKQRTQVLRTSPDLGVLFLGELFLGELFLGVLFLGVLFLGVLFLGVLFLGVLFLGVLFFYKFVFFIFFYVNSSDKMPNISGHSSGTTSGSVLTSTI
jgi:hypothetical protein